MKIILILLLSFMLFNCNDYFPEWKECEQRYDDYVKSCDTLSEFTGECVGILIIAKEALEQCQCSGKDLQL